MRISFLHFGFVVVATTASIGAVAQAIHTPFQTRAPVQCGPFTTFNGTSAAAQRIFQCAEERNPLPSGSNLYLVEDLALQVGGARAPTAGEAITLTNLAEGSRVYPVRGTYTRVQCEIVRDTAPLDNRGRSCNEYYYGGQGQCFLTAFGDWKCGISWGTTKASLMGVAPRNWGRFQPIATTQDTTTPVAPTPTETQPSPAPRVQPGGRRVTRDPNRPIAMHETVNYDDPDNRGVVNSCTVQGVFVGAFKVQCRNLNPMNQIVRDIDVKRPGGRAPQTSAAGPVVAPFKPNDLVLATTMGLMDEKYWKLCIVLRNSVRTNNSYGVDCGNGEMNVLPEWVRADPDFE